MFVKYKLIK